MRVLVTSAGAALFVWLCVRLASGSRRAITVRVRGGAWAMLLWVLVVAPCSPLFEGVLPNRAGGR